MSSKRGRVVVFDVWSDFAFFRRPYSTTTSLTYNIMPRSAIEGLLGAILGIPYREVYPMLSDCQIALGVIEPVRKFPFSNMHIHTDFWQQMSEYLDGEEWKKQRNYSAIVSLELLVSPKYRVYFTSEKLLPRLEDALKNHHTIFTPYLGTSTMIANFEYVGTFDYHEVKRKETEISSIVPYSNSLPDIVVERGQQYAIEQDIPGRINSDRELQSSYSAVYSPQGGTMKIRDVSVASVAMASEVQDIVFIPA